MQYEVGLRFLCRNQAAGLTLVDQGKADNKKTSWQVQRAVASTSLTSKMSACQFCTWRTTYPRSQGLEEKKTLNEDLQVNQNSTLDADQGRMISARHVRRMENPPCRRDMRKHAASDSKQPQKQGADLDLGSSPRTGDPGFPNLRDRPHPTS